MSKLANAYYSIQVHGRTSTVTADYPNPIRLDPDKRYLLGITGGYIPVTLINVTSGHNTIRLSRDNGTTWLDIVIPEGNYDINAIGQYLFRIQQETPGYLVHGGDTPQDADDIVGIFVEYDFSSMKTFIRLQPGFQIDFHEMHNFFGFNLADKIVSVDMTYSPNIPHVEGEYVYFKIICNLCEPQADANVNTLSQNLYVNTFTAGTGSIQELPQNNYVQWKLMRQTNEISRVSITVTDHLNKPIDLRGQQCFFNIDIRPIAS